MTSQSAEVPYSSVDVRKQTEEQTSSTEILEYLKLISLRLCFVPHVAAAEICWRFKTIESFTSVVLLHRSAEEEWKHSETQK